MTPPLPATVIGGYLGAGKTTLVNHLLRHANGRKLAVLVNEFGDLAIDEDLIEAQDDQMISISGGCICCSFGSDLTQAMIDLAALDPRPDHVVIEASGVAMPGAIAASISILDGYALSGIVVVADGERVQAQARDEYLGDTTRRQLADADLILQSKTDLLPALQSGSNKDWLAQIAPHAQVLPMTKGQVPLDVVLGVEPSGALNAANAHRDTDYVSEVMIPNSQIDATALVTALQAPSLGILRAKGFFTDISGTLHLLQMVGTRAEISPADPNRKPGIVFIGLKNTIQLDVIRNVITASTRSN